LIDLDRANYKIDLLPCFIVFVEACVGCDEGEAAGVAKDGHTAVARWAADETRQVAGDEIGIRHRSIGIRLTHKHWARREGG